MPLDEPKEILGIKDPIALFQAWMADAEASEVNDANAMAVATADAQGRPSVRILLLKGVDDRGFVFYSNFESRKGGELKANPHAALNFHWKSLRRCVRAEGPVAVVGEDQADAYFASRDRGSRLGAWASKQSQPLDEWATFEARLQEFDQKYPGDEVPRPPHWSGWRLEPVRIEFWVERKHRLHERYEFTRATADQPWSAQMLFP